VPFGILGVYMALRAMSITERGDEPHLNDSATLHSGAGGLPPDCRSQNAEQHDSDGEATGSAPLARGIAFPRSAQDPREDRSWGYGPPFDSALTNSFTVEMDSFTAPLDTMTGGCDG
jgi:hypothetical protein